MNKHGCRFTLGQGGMHFVLVNVYQPFPNHNKKLTPFLGTTLLSLFYHFCLWQNIKPHSKAKKILQALETVCKQIWIRPKKENICSCNRDMMPLVKRLISCYFTVSHSSSILSYEKKKRGGGGSKWKMWNIRCEKYIYNI